MRGKTTYSSNGFGYLLMDTVCVLILAFLFVPQFQLLNYYNYWVTSLLAFWIAVSFLCQPGFYLGRNPYVKLALLYCALTVLLPLIFNVPVVANRYASLALPLLFYCIYSYNSRYRDSKVNGRIILLSVPFIIYTAYKTIIALYSNPYISRLIKSSGEESMEIWAMGVSGYTLIYSCLILVLAATPLVLERRRLRLSLWKFALLVALLGMIIVLVTLSNYFTAFVLLILGLALFMVMYYNRAILFLLIPLGIFYFSFQKDMNLFLVESFIAMTPDNGKTNERLQQIRTNILFSTRTDGVNTRAEVINQSVDMVYKYPLGGYIASNHSVDFQLDNIGQHSYILDTFALYGIFIGTLGLWCFWYPFAKRVKKRQPYRLKVYGWIVGAIFMVLLFANNLTPTIGYAALFVFPTIYDHLDRKLYAGRGLPPGQGK